MSKSQFLGITEQHVPDDLKHKGLQTNDQTSAVGTANYSLGNGFRLMTHPRSPRRTVPRHDPVLA